MHSWLAKVFRFMPAVKWTQTKIILQIQQVCPAINNLDQFALSLSAKQQNAHCAGAAPILPFRPGSTQDGNTKWYAQVRHPNDSSYWCFHPCWKVLRTIWQNTTWCWHHQPGGSPWPAWHLTTRSVDPSVAFATKSWTSVTWATPYHFMRNLLAPSGWVIQRLQNWFASVHVWPFVKPTSASNPHTSLLQSGKEGTSWRLFSTSSWRSCTNNSRSASLNTSTNDVTGSIICVSSFKRRKRIWYDSHMFFSSKNPIAWHPSTRRASGSEWVDG